MTFQTLSNNWLEGNYAGLEPQYIGLHNDQFKLQDIKIFASSNPGDASLFPDYRTVFEKAELDYLCVQAGFENKCYHQKSFFSKKDWYASIRLRCGKRVSGSWVDVCSFDMSREILTTESMVTIHNGWGTAQKGSFWEEGEYYWDVWINNKLLVLQYFFINDIGAPLHDNGQPYFNKLVFQFFDPLNKTEGKFFKAFNKKNTVDIGFNALLYPMQTKPFYGEFIFTGMFNNQRILYLRTNVFYIEKINPDLRDYFQYWVNSGRFKEPGQWQEGNYTFSVSFLKRRNPYNRQNDFLKMFFGTNCFTVFNVKTFKNYLNRQEPSQIVLTFLCTAVHAIIFSALILPCFLHNI